MNESSVSSKFQTQLRQALPGRAVENEWKEAVIEACIVNFISWDENDPHKTLANLINWKVKIALDPSVSKAAQDLIDRGKQL